jgi:nucleotide-binding universal stress UspA family protein
MIPPSSLSEVHLKTTRVRFANILVAVDLSAASANTMKIAAEFAYQHRSRLVVAHIMEHRAAAPAETPAETEATLRLWMRPYLRSGAHCSVAVAEGDVVSEISSLVKKHSADLLIIGTHAATNVERLVLGSTAEALFRNSSIPVLTIGPHVRNCKAGFSTILLPTDLEPDSLRAAQYAVSLAEESNATLNLLHVVGKSDGVAMRQMAAVRMQQLVPEDAALWCTPLYRIESGDLTETILAVAEDTRSDLIVLSVTQARLLADHAHWSVASRIVRFAACPVLTVRDHL